MPEVDINDIADKGIGRDEPSYQLPPEVWTTALNMRVRDGGMVKMEGWSQVFGTPGVTPHFAMSVLSPNTAFWLYSSLTKIYGYDGTNHTNITRQTAAVDVDYTGTETREWNGTLFGGIPILNNGNDAPQFWGALSLGTKMADLTNWTANMKAQVIRAFGAYLVAFRINKSGTIYPHMVKWSSESVGPGVLPASWDATDETKDSGEYDLPDTDSGLLQEARQLGGKMFIYKDAATWVMRFVGGRSVFAFDPLYTTSGILAPRCVTVTGDGRNHVVATQDDLIIHNGGEPASILNKRLRREIFANIDSTNYVNSFLYVDPENSEVVFAYPETGRINPSRGLVFNYKNGAITEKDGITYRNAAIGRVQNPTTETWDSAAGTWDTDLGAWDTQERRRVLLCGTDDTKFFKLNDGATRNGVVFFGTLQRLGLAVIGRKRSGEWIVDHQRLKMVDRLWPKIKNSNSVQIRIGYQDTVDGVVTWGNYAVFDAATQVFVESDPPNSGRATSIEFRSSDAQWRLDGYKINVLPLGTH